MTIAEIKEVVRLLLCLCPARAPVIDRDFARAWAAALEPYDYAAVRSAALDHARRKVFFPAVSDLLRSIPAPAVYRNDLALAEKKLQQRKG
jgi:hypothetical protein